MDQYGVSLDDLFDIEGAGLIRSAEAITLNYAESDSEAERVDYAGSPALLKLDGHQVHSIQFTTAGQEIRRLVAMDRCQSYTEALKKKLADDFDPDVT